MPSQVDANTTHDEDAYLASLPDGTLRELLSQRTKERTGCSPFDFQLDAAVGLIRNKDVVVKAGTGSGKTLSFVMPCFVSRKTVVVVISPLNVLGEDQVSLLSLDCLSPFSSPYTSCITGPTVSRVGSQGYGTELSNSLRRSTFAQGGSDSTLQYSSPH